MIDYLKIIIGLAMVLIGIIITIPNIKDKLNGRVDKYGGIMKSLFGGIGMIIIGIIMILNELF